MLVVAAGLLAPAAWLTYEGGLATYSTLHLCLVSLVTTRTVMWVAFLALQPLGLGLIIGGALG